MPEMITDEEIRTLIRAKIRERFTPASVYRLQFNRDFTFKNCTRLIPFFKALGVQAIYASPYFQAAPGSMHGYDITDPTKINAEIGSEQEFEEFCAAIKQNGLEQILDIVPNHMGITGNRNPWWQDVLENGPASIYAAFFDIDWEPTKKELKDKILIPILGDYYGAVLENQEITLSFSEGRFIIRYYSHELPVAPETYPFILEWGIEDLQSKCQKEDADLLEYLSIITAFRHLPPRSESDPEKKSLRHREKEITKKRLASLADKSKAIQEFISSRLIFFNGQKGKSKSFNLLDQLLNEQAYRMAFWRVASEEINYRRFFNINELAAIRTEDPEVFKACHEFIFRLVREGKVRGLRIDHPDGLYDPPEYFRRLQNECLLEILFEEIQKRAGETMEPGSERAEGMIKTIGSILNEPEFAASLPLYMVAEKILEFTEKLPEDWNVCGTVGYEFMNALNGLFIKRENEKAINEIYEKFIGHPIDFTQALYEKKKFFALVHMASEVNALGHRLDLISEHHRRFRDFTRNHLTLAIREVIACFPVYRTYISPRDVKVSERDKKYITMAVEKAKRKTPALSASVYDFLKKILLLEWEGELEAEDEILYRDFVLRFQQLTGPVMAKGLEDTTFYIYNRLVSLNEVGGDPTHFGYSVEEFHLRNEERNKRWPYALLATSTHDTKRSEDMRVRIDVLSEMPDEWNEKIEGWSRLNEKFKTKIQDVPEPRRNAEYFIYQSLLGIWPDGELASSDYPVLTERMWNYLLKSSREAKVYTSWIQPNLEYEEALKKFIYGILSPEGENPFLKDFQPFQKKIAGLGLWNALSQVVLKIGSPGVVDTYQGNELWNYCLVDPDNRGPVDFEIRKQYLNQFLEMEAKGQSAEAISSELVKSKWDGRLKLYVLWKGLQLRLQNPEVFIGGDYLPLKIEGERKENVIAFMRCRAGKIALIVAGRFFADLFSGSEQTPTGKEVWRNTEIILPENIGENTKLTDIFSGKEAVIFQRNGSTMINVDDLLSALSVSILTGELEENKRR